MSEQGEGNYGFVVTIPGQSAKTYWFKKESVRNSRFQDEAKKIGKNSRIRKVDRKSK